MSGAEGSKPTLTVRRFRSIRRASSTSSIRSTAPRRRISSSGEGEVTSGQDSTGLRRHRLRGGLRGTDRAVFAHTLTRREITIMETNRERNLRLFMAAALALLLAPPLLSDTVTLPAVTSFPVGAAASPFFSDVRVFNTSYTSPVSVTAVYRCFLGACPGAAPQVPFTLSPRESRPFDDMISSAFNAPSTAGAVEFSSSGSSVRVTSRLYSPVAGGGTNGMFVPGMKVSDAHAASVLTELSNGLF